MADGRNGGGGGVEGRRVRVLLDASNFRAAQSGLRTYTLGVVGGLASRETLDLVVASSLPDDFRPLGVEAVDLPMGISNVAVRTLWRERELPGLIRRVGADVLLVLLPELPLRRTSVPSIVVVHDVGPLVAPSLYGARKFARYWIGLRHINRRASRVVCVSHASRQALQARIGVDPVKCVVITEAPQAIDEWDAAAKGGDYVLYVGSFHRHKNLNTLLRAAALDPSLVLRLCGPISARDRKLLNEHARKLGIADRVVHEGFVTRRRLAELYASAFALALPSLHEGFGLTVAEALQLGTPAVSTALASVQEFAGDAVLYVADPLKPADWCSAFAALRANPKMRRDLVERGRRRSAGWSWSRVADGFERTILEVAG